MNKDILEGKWQQLKGKVMEQWGELTDDEVDVASGQYDQLSGKLQEKYGYSKDEAEREIDRFVDSCDC